MGVATEADVVAFAGEPDETWNDDNPYTSEEAVVLGYHCARPGHCQTAYGINRSTDTLANFSTRSKNFRTRCGTRVGSWSKRSLAAALRGVA
jgi:hypothetical protein